MDSIIAIIFGIVQGATEFLPVSSSGHLLILHKFFPGFSMSDALAFDVALHIGTLVAVVWFFWADVVKYAVAGVKSLMLAGNGADPHNMEHKSAGPSAAERTDMRIAWLILLATIPAGAAGFFFEDLITEWFWQTALVSGVMFILVGVLFLVVEYAGWGSHKRKMEDMRFVDALVIGIAQVLALIPGTSRSGITLVGGMVMKLSREQAARFSFLLSIPLIAGAGLKKGLDLANIGVVGSEIPALIFGFLASLVVGYVVIKWLLEYFMTNTLKPFAWYRIGLGVLIIVLTNIGYIS